MKRKCIAALLAVCILVMVLSMPLFAAETDSAGNIFEAGEQVTLSDVPFFGAFAMGKDVDLNQAAAKGSVAVMGTGVSVAGSSIDETLYAGGGDVLIKDTAIKGNVFLIGNNVSLIGENSCNGAYLMGRDIIFEGKANALNASGKAIRIKGTINGDVNLKADKVGIDPDTVVNGTLNISAAEEPVIPESAQIGSYNYSKVENKKADGGGKEKTGEAGEKKDDDSQSTVTSGIGAKIGKTIFWIVATAILGLILCWFFDKHLNSAGEMIKDNLGPYIGKGIGCLFLIPLLSILLCITVILAPVGVILLILYALLVFMGTAFTGSSVSRLLLPNLNVFLAAVIGIAVLQILKMIPFVGWIIRIATGIYILSYVFQYIWRNRLRKNKEVI